MDLTDMVEPLEKGTKAPDFESVDQNGEKIRLSDFDGKVRVVYFYPRDNTPGCTKEACNFRDNYEEYEKKGIKVFGISVDSQKAHKNFSDKYELNFSLVVDNSKEISENYGVLGTSSAKRITYIIDKDGTVAHVYPKVNPQEHAAEVLQKIEDLGL